MAFTEPLAYLLKKKKYRNDFLAFVFMYPVYAYY